MLGLGLVTLLLVKWIIWSVSLGSGTSGGVLAPLLIMGAALGGCEAHLFPNLGAGYWQVISMGAILGGTMRSPFTGIIFVLELTHDINLMLPLLLAVTCAHAFTVLLLKRSILTEKVSRRGFHVTREYETEPTEIIFAREVMEVDAPVLRASLSPQAVAKFTTELEPKPSFVAVVDDQRHLLGVAAPSVVLGWAIAAEAGSTPPLQSVLTAAVTAFPDESLRTVVNRMATSGLTALPVVDRKVPTLLLGQVDLHHLLKARVLHLKEEHHRERVLPLRKLLTALLRTPTSLGGSP